MCIRDSSYKRIVFRVVINICYGIKRMFAAMRIKFHMLIHNLQKDVYKRQLPSCAGLSITMLKPVFIPGPIIIASQPVIFFIALFIVIVTVGTTDDIIAPSISEKSML